MQKFPNLALFLIVCLQKAPDTKLIEEDDRQAPPMEGLEE
jgi:hypothetical protein